MKGNRLRGVKKKGRQGLMRYSIFNYFCSKKYVLYPFTISVRSLLGWSDFYDRFLFIILADTMLNLCLFIYNYVYYRFPTIYSYIEEKLNSFKEQKANFDILHDSKKFCIGKKNILSDRQRCKYSAKGQKDIYFLFNTNSTYIVKNPFLK